MFNLNRRNIYTDDLNAFTPSKSINVAIHRKYGTAENLANVQFQKSFTVEFEAYSIQQPSSCALFGLAMSYGGNWGIKISCAQSSRNVVITYAASDLTAVSSTFGNIGGTTLKKVIVSYDFNAMVIRYMVDGTSGSTTITKALREGFINSINICSGSGDNNRRGFFGAIRNVRIFNTSSSSADLATIHNGGTFLESENMSSPMSDSILYCWRLNQTNGMLMKEDIIRANAGLVNVLTIDATQDGDAWREY